MANLEFCDTHDMVAYLLKTERSEGFHQILDFLNTSHIKYALTKNPTIYVSLIQQFWQTVVVNTLNTREVQIFATIDGKFKLVSEASIRRHLNLEDSDGISTFPNTKIFEQLALLGPKKTSWEQISSNIATAIICLIINRTFNFSKMISEGMGEGSTVLVESHHTPSGAPTTSQPLISSPSRIPIRQEAEVPQPSSPTHTHVADEAASIDAAKVHTYTRRRRAINTGSDGIKIASRIVNIAKETVSTAGASMPISTAGMIDKGKGIMEESESVQTKTKRKQEQKRLGLEAAVRLQE
nr:xylulose kinase-1 [Tanacetum cinerariifolium]